MTIPALLAIPFFAILVITGVPIDQCALAAIVFWLEGLVGLALWGKGFRVHHWSVTAAGAVVLGCGVSSLALIWTPDPWRWTALIAASSIAIGRLAQTRREIPLPSLPSIGTLWVLALSSLALMPHLLSNPARVSGWTQFFGDFPYHEALAQSLSTFGPLETTFRAGTQLRYHWLADAWSGTLSDMAGFGPLIGTTRAVYAYAVVASVAAAWGLGRSLSRHRWAPAGAVIGLLLSSFLVVGIKNTYSVLETDLSPTQTFAVPAVLLCLLGILHWRDGRYAFGYFSILVALGFLLAISRAPSALVLLSAATLGIAASGWAAFRSHWKAITGLGVGAVAAYMLVLSGGPPNGLRLGPNLEVAGVFGLIPYVGPGYVVASIIMFSLSVTLPFFLLTCRSRGSAQVEIARRIAAFAVLLGPIFCLLLAQPGRGQVSFLWAAYTVAGPVAGLLLITEISRFSRPTVLWMTVACLLLSGVLVAIVLMTGTMAFSGYGRFALLLILAGLAALAWYRGASSKYGVLLLGTSWWAALLSSLLLAASPRTVVDASTPLSISPAHVEASIVAERLSPVGALWATNQQCGEIGRMPPECGSIAFTASSLVPRRFLIEGADYSVVNIDPTAAADIADSAGIGTATARQAAHALEQRGVTYVWLDKRYTTSELWREVGLVVFENTTVALIKLAGR